MGGLGSGRWHGKTRRLTTGLCVSIDLADMGLREASVTHLFANVSNHPLVSVSWAPSLSRVVVEAMTSTDSRGFSVELSTTRPHLGGVRYWFICPQCSHSRRVLRLTPALDLGCQGCLNLAYPTQRLNRYWRMNRRLDLLWSRLGGTEESHGKRYWPRRPKWGRRATQERLKAEYEALNAAIWGEGMRCLEGLFAKRHLYQGPF